LFSNAEPAIHVCYVLASRNNTEVYHRDAFACWAITDLEEIDMLKNFLASNMMIDELKANQEKP
jgi:hypothetical protein